MSITIPVFLERDIVWSDSSLQTRMNVLFPPSGEKCKLSVEKCGHDTGNEDVGAWSKKSATIYQATQHHNPEDRKRICSLTFRIIP